MKAILKKNNKIVYVEALYKSSDTHGLYPFNDLVLYKDTMRNIEYNPEDLSFDKDRIIEIEKWEQRRYEIAKSIIQGIVSNWYNSSVKGSLDESISFLCDDSMLIADKLIKRLKEGRK